MFVKVCGLTRPEEVDWAGELGYDAVGFVASARSKRYCPPQQLRALAARARGRLLSFCVAYQYEELAEVADCFDVIQLYEPVPLRNLALAAAQPPAMPCEYFFYDASIGSGVFREIPAWVETLPGKVVIAGGLNGDNVGAVIRRYRPYGVDVSSALESAPGIKERPAMAAFMAAVRAAG